MSIFLINIFMAFYLLTKQKTKTLYEPGSL